MFQRIAQYTPQGMQRQGGISGPHLDLFEVAPHLATVYHGRSDFYNVYFPWTYYGTHIDPRWKHHIGHIFAATQPITSIEDLCLMIGPNLSFGTTCYASAVQLRRSWSPTTVEANQSPQEEQEELNKEYCSFWHGSDSYDSFRFNDFEDILKTLGVRTSFYGKALSMKPVLSSWEKLSQAEVLALPWPKVYDDNRRGEYWYSWMPPLDTPIERTCVSGP